MTKRLTEIDFSGTGAHIALCHKTQGVANGKDKALILKAKTMPSIQEEIQKAQVQVTMDFCDYLQKFYGLYYDDAEALAMLLGMEEPEDDTEVEYNDNWYQDYIASKIEGVEILKALHESEDVAKSYSELKPKDLLLVLKEQAKLEKAMDGYSSKKKKKSKASPKTQMQKDTPMTVETVSKADHELILKSLEEQKQALTKALETLAGYEAEKKEMIAKGRKAEIAEVLTNESQQESVYKALENVTDEDFISVVAVMKSLASAKEMIEKSNLFTETGASGEAEDTSSAATTALLNKAVQKALKKNK